MAAAMLVLFWWLGVSASLNWSHTSDELPHITSGYAYNKFSDYRFQPENGILPQRLHGLPPLFLDAKFPMTEVYWRNSLFWDLGWSFLYESGNPLGTLLLSARALNALFGVALGWFIYRIASQWYTRAGGLLALGFYGLCPNFLAHSPLATSDLAGTLMLTLAPWFFWRHLERRDLPSGLLAGLCSGLAMVAKFNGLLLLPIYACLGAIDAVARSGAQSSWRRLAANFGLGGAQALGAGLVIWMFYGFRFQAAAPGLPPLEQFSWPWRPDLLFHGWKGALLLQARQWQLLPEAYLQGLNYVLASEVARPAFLAGEYSTAGWRSFFPVLFLVKTPLAMLGALLLALGLGLTRWLKLARSARGACLLRWIPLAVPALVVWVFALNSSLNIGHRHILPVYPALFVAVGGLATALNTRWRVIAVALLAGQAIESFVIRPHYLAFFNPLAGGPERAYRLVVDSSLDWGQDLPALHTWLERNRQPEEPLYLSYFGNAWPPHYGVRPTRFLPAPSLVHPLYARYDFQPGLYCVSATTLAGVYSGFTGSWQPEWEHLYRTASPDTELFDRVRFARLARYLQGRAPDANAGHSILIFRLGAAELRAALTGPVTGWSTSP